MPNPHCNENRSLGGHIAPMPRGFTGGSTDYGIDRIIDGNNITHMPHSTPALPDALWGMPGEALDLDTE